MKRMIWKSHLLLGTLLLLAQGCNKKELKRPEGAGSPSNQNQSPISMDEEEVRKLARVFAQELAAELARQGTSLATTTNENKDTLESPVLRLNSAPEVLDFYNSNPEHFTITNPSNLPENLKWESGADLEEFASPNAKRGGTFMEYMPDFPRTLRLLGPDGNGSFRSYILDYNAVSLVDTHPENDGYYPGLAKEWAVDKSNNTVYFRLDPEAKYSDGNPVKATDYFFCLYFMRSPHIQAPWYNDFYSTEKYPNITIFDEHTISITYYKSKPDLLEKCAAIRPIPEHFYKELDEQWVEDYQFEFEPTTGPYEVLKENVRKGESITLTRVPNWWADKKRFFRYRYNPDAIKVTVVRELAKVFELFTKGELDWHGLGLPEFWYDKLPDEHQLVANGHVEKLQFYNDVPRPTWALRLNSSHPILSNKDIRLGLNHAMNFEVVINEVFRGDYDRMRSVADGYGPRSHPKIRAREFSVEKAREYFALAGYTDTGEDGILQTPEGKRLSFSFSTGYKRLEDVMTVLKEEARKAGVDLQIEMLESTSAFKKVSEKKHEIHLVALNVSVEMYPRFWEPYHSDNAYKEPKEERYDEKGHLRSGLTPKPVTNNFTLLADKEVDDLIEKYRVSEDLGEITDLSHKLIEKIHDYGAYIPGWVRPWYRVGQWRWVKYPKGYNVKESREPFEFHIHWIDTEEKKRILDNIASGQKSGEPAINIFDQHKLD